MKTYQIIALTKSGRLWQSDICYKNYEMAQLQRKSLLQDSENLQYVTIKELLVL